MQNNNHNNAESRDEIMEGTKISEYSNQFSEELSDISSISNTTKNEPGETIPSASNIVTQATNNTQEELQNMQTHNKTCWQKIQDTVLQPMKNLYFNNYTAIKATTGLGSILFGIGGVVTSSYFLHTGRDGHDDWDNAKGAFALGGGIAAITSGIDALCDAYTNYTRREQASGMDDETISLHEQGVNEEDFRASMRR